MRLAFQLGVVFCTAASTMPEAAPRIDHVGLECIEPGTYAVVLSGIDPGMDIQTAKVYFRSALYPDFYYVEMTREKDGFVGILPQASPETPRVIYYVEAVDQWFESARSQEFDPPVEDPCKDRPGAAYLPETPSIVVGATTAGASTLPPGFSAMGIVGTITALGVSSGVGGGIGAGTAVAVAAGVAGGVAGGVVVVSQANETTSTTTAIALPSSPTTTAPTTTAVPGSPTSTTSTTSVPGAPTTTAPGPSTTTLPGPSTSTTPGPSTTTVSTTTAPVSTTSIAAGPLNPDCFTIQVLGVCHVRLDATCVNLPVDRYDWILDVDGKFKTVTFSNGPPSLTYQWDSQDCDTDKQIEFFLRVHRGPFTASAEKEIKVPGKPLIAFSSRRTFRLETHLALPPLDGSLHGRLILNGTLLRVVDNGQPAVMELERVPHESLVEAVVGRSGGAPGTWRFGFPGASELRVLEGTVLALEPDAVVFRLSGTPGETVRFSFVVEP